MFALYRFRWPWRIAIKWGLFGLTVFVVCFPYPTRFIRHVRHWRDPNALVEPDALALRPLLEQLRPTLGANLPPEEILKRVEQFVCDRIEYEWDWEIWGTADYLPTVTEAVEKGREDCDGRAVVSASLLRHLGFQAELVTDFAHVWVRTEFGETMGPGRAKAVIAANDGLRIQPGAWAQLPQALAYGIAPFPLVRELVVVVVMWLLLRRPQGGVLCDSVALMLFVGGLMLLRGAGGDYRQPLVWLQLLAGVIILAGFFCMMVWARRNARRARAAATCTPTQVNTPGTHVRSCPWD